MVSGSADLRRDTRIRGFALRKRRRHRRYQAWRDLSDGNLAASLHAAIHRAYGLRGGDGAAARPCADRSRLARLGAAAFAGLFRADAARHPRPDSGAARGAAQLSDLGASALPAGGSAAGDAAIFLREREGRQAVQPRHPRGGVSARQDGPRQAPVRHPGGRLCRRLRMDASFGGAAPACDGAVPHHHRRAGLRKALFGLGVQYLGDEFRRAQPERGAGAERRRQEGRLRARHRRGRRQPLSSRVRRRSDLGDRLRLFRLPDAAMARSIRTPSPHRRATTRSR